jgi:23S rRNA pseudouridine2605 synthase
MQRLSKILTSFGIASRRGSEKIIFENRVKVNGKLINTPQTMVSEEDIIEVDNKKLKNLEKKVYYVLNKPKGLTCTNCTTTKKRVIDLFNIDVRLFTVGRLDKNTTGLLIVTNDGHFANRVIHPSFNIEKEYLVRVSTKITHKHLISISKGAFIEKKLRKPVAVKKVNSKILKITVKEGKKHEVRIFVKKADLKILELKRIRIGFLKLNSLLEGEYREMKKEEILRFKKN